MLRSPWETSPGGHLQPLCTLLQLGYPWGTWGLGLLRTPLGLCPWGWDPQQLPCSFAGVGAAPCSISRGSRLSVLGLGGSKQLLFRTHSPFWEEWGVCRAGRQCRRALGDREASTAIGLSNRYPCVCVCACTLSPGQVQICLWLWRCCVDLPGDAHGRQPSSFPTDGFQGLPFTAEPIQLIPAVGCFMCPCWPGSAPTALGRSGSRRL